MTDMAERIARLPKVPPKEPEIPEKGYPTSGLAFIAWQRRDSQEITALRARNELLAEALEIAMEDLTSGSQLLPKGEALFREVLAQCKVQP
jgi:hypothetical protein